MLRVGLRKTQVFTLKPPSHLGTITMKITIKGSSNMNEHVPITTITINAATRITTTMFPLLGIVYSLVLGVMVASDRV